VDFGGEEGMKRVISRSEEELDGRRLLIKDGKSFDGRPQVRRERFQVQRRGPWAIREGQGHGGKGSGEGGSEQKEEKQEVTTSDVVVEGKKRKKDNEGGEEGVKIQKKDASDDGSQKRMKRTKGNDDEVVKKKKKKSRNTSDKPSTDIAP
jgi:hypothetical protein